MEQKVEDPWLCEASRLEELYNLAQKRGTLMMVYQLGLSTVHSLQEDHVRRALVYLQRNCPIFQICFEKRNGKTWIRKAENQDIDFQVVYDMDADEVRDALQTYKYPEKGPLWCARLKINVDTDEYAMDEGFPHTSQLFLGITHSIADGTSMLIVLGGFVRTLEDIIAGKSIRDEPIGRFVSDTKNDKLVALKMDVLQRDQGLLQELSVAVNDKGIEMPLLLSAIPPPGGEDKTGSLTNVLDRDTTKRFIDRCKSEGVTVHSAFSATVNVSIIKLLVEKQMVKNTYRLCSAHLISLRRYWPGDTSGTLGCHAHFPLNLWTDVPRDILENNFWDYARTLHQDLHRHLKEETILLREAYAKLNSPDLSYDDIFHPKKSMQNDGGFSNLGNITDYLTDKGVHVRPYLLKRRLSISHISARNFNYFFHTLRGRLILDINYTTNYYRLGTVKTHMDQIFGVLNEVIKP